MRIQSPDPGPIAGELDTLARLLPLAGARIADLGCGRAELTAALSARHPDATVTAFEVDLIQHRRNLARQDLPNVRFVFGGADAIPADDETFDVVLMAKSLHHVPVAAMDVALSEIGRVLVTGGVAAFVEPVYAGEFNALVSLFHDERVVRETAFAALGRAIAGGGFELAAEEFYIARRRFADFAEFEDRLIRATHTEHRLTAEQYAAVRARFAASAGADGAGADGAVFEQPMRVDVLRRR
jgi:SAM-dependent methyltransferase